MGLYLPCLRYWDELTHATINRGSFTVLLGEVQGLLSQVLKLVRDWISSLVCHRRRGVKGRVPFPSFHHHVANKGSRASSPTLLPVGLVHLHPCLKGQLYCVAQPMYSACSPKCYSW